MDTLSAQCSNQEVQDTLKNQNEVLSQTQTAIDHMKALINKKQNSTVGFLQ